MQHPDDTRHFDATVVVAAPASVVWDTLVRPERMQAWLGEPEMAIEVATDWNVGEPIIVRGFHHQPFENRGTVLRFERPRRLSYTHSSSLSPLPDRRESYTTLDFRLNSRRHTTSLNLVMTGFPTMTIFKHLQFYWHGTLNVVKQHAERHWRAEAQTEHGHEIQR